MKKLIFLVPLVLIVFGVVLFAGDEAEKAEKPCEKTESSVEGKVFEYDSKLGKVTFDHDQHAKTEKIACKKCHHMMKDESETPKGCKTAGCHSKDDKVPPKDAYHKLCMDCHKDAAKEGKKAPAKCKECHVK